jgi:hypothetical protein
MSNVDQFGQVSDVRGLLEAYRKVRSYKSRNSELGLGVNVGI